MTTRFLLVRKGCSNCRDFIKAIRIINLRLPIEKRIKIIDCWLWEEYGVDINPIMSKFKEELEEGYPLCYIDGIQVEPSEPDILKTYISKLVEDDIRR